MLGATEPPGPPSGSGATPLPRRAPAPEEAAPHCALEDGAGLKDSGACFKNKSRDPAVP